MWVDQAPTIGKVLSIVRSPSSDETALILLSRDEVKQSAGCCVITTNAGGSYTKISSRKFIEEAVFHPTNARTILARSPNNIHCGSFYSATGKSDDECNMELVITYDGGMTWKVLNTYVYAFRWDSPTRANAGYVVLESATKKGNQFSVRSDFELGKRLQLVDHKGKSFILPNAATIVDFSVDEDFLVVTAANNGLYVSKMDVNSWQFFDVKPAVLPAEITVTSSTKFTPVTVVSGMLLMSISSSSTTSSLSQSVSLYSSDGDGLRYTLSLPRLHHEAFNGDYFDFVKVGGLEGIFIANQVQTTPTTSTTSAIKTKISFDNGGSWVWVKPPTVNAMNQPIPCLDQCSLHLHGMLDYSRGFAPIYSADNALGLILATGNVGTYLFQDRDAVNTYLSRDGGLTWMEIAQGPHIYEYGDHGSLMVIVPHLTPTRTIKYSWDEGLTWTDLAITRDGTVILVDNIILDPDVTSLRFLVYGSINNKVVVIFLDFSTLAQRPCALANAPTDPASDYELWAPSSAPSSTASSLPEVTTAPTNCLLGHKTWYIRRKRTSQCVNGANFERENQRVNCPCEAIDFECDFGFEMSLNEKEELLCVGKINYDAPSPCDGVYSVSSGYRRVPADTCSGGDDRSPKTMLCPSQPVSWTSVFDAKFYGMSLTGTIIIFALFMTVAVLLAPSVSKYCCCCCGFGSSEHKYGRDVGIVYRGVEDAAFKIADYDADDVFDDALLNSTNRAAISPIAPPSLGNNNNNNSNKKSGQSITASQVLKPDNVPDESAASQSPLRIKLPHSGRKNTHSHDSGSNSKVDIDIEMTSLDF